MKKTTIHEQTYVFVSWEASGKRILELSKKILQSGKTYDRIIALAKGGLTWSRLLSDYIAVEELSSVQISFYTGIAKTKKLPSSFNLSPSVLKVSEYLFLMTLLILEKH